MQPAAVDSPGVLALGARSRTASERQVEERRRRWPAKVGRLALDLVLLAALLVATWEVGVRSTDFVGTPKGADALDHASTVKLLMQDFPHVLWNPAWFSGMKLLPGIYPPLYHLIIATAVAASGTTIEHAMVVCTAVAFLVMTASAYGFVRLISRSSAAAAVAGAVVLAVPAFWQPSLRSGEYPRLIAMAFACLATFLAALYTRKPGRLRLTAVIIAATCGMSTHDLTGGLGVLQVLGVLLFVNYRPLAERIKVVAGVAAAVAAMVLWLYLPTLVGFHAYYLIPQPRFVPNTGTSYRRLFETVGSSLKAFSPLLLPLTLLLMAAAAWFAWRRSSFSSKRFRQCVGASAAMLIVALVVLTYAYIGRFTHADLEIVGIYPNDMFTYAAWPLATTCGLLLAALASELRSRLRYLWRSALYVAPALAAVVCLVATVPVLKRDAFSYQQTAEIQLPIMPGSNGTKQYRLALTDATETSWINFFTNVPEVGGPFNQGAVNFTWSFWAESVLSNDPPSVAEMKFMLNWNAVRWIQAGSGPSAYGFYQDHPALFRYVGPSADNTYHNFVVRQTSPILAATDAPPVLIVGSAENYNLLLRALALTDVGPNTLIPVQGEANLNDYSLKELEQFPEIFLYGFQASNPRQAAKLLRGYVRHGGGLVIDVGGAAGLAAELAKDGAPLPVTKWRSFELYQSWHFAPSKSSLLRGIDLAKFSPAVYAQTFPYLVEGASQRSPGSSVDLLSDGRPVLVDEHVGKSTVIESGLNLPYHDDTFSNTTESSLLARLLLSSIARSWASAPANAGRAKITTDADLLRTAGAEGVLFKEDDSPGWHAYVDGRPSSVYPAGLGYMYVRLEGSSSPATVRFQYELSGSEWATIVTALLALVVLGAYLIGVPLPRRIRRRLERAKKDIRATFRGKSDAIRLQRARVAELLADPAPDVRLQGLSLLRGEPALQPYGDLLLEEARTERDDECIQALVALVAAFQWEPIASPEIAKLRRWAASVHRATRV
jgi:hypothetical protein